MQYRPSIIQNNYKIYQALSNLPGDIPSQQKLNTIMENIYGYILGQAKQLNLAMIDLPNSFDIYDSKLYRSQIEPSSAGGDIIAKLIKETIGVKEHVFFYTKKDGEVEKYKLEPNAQWKVFIDWVNIYSNI